MPSSTPDLTAIIKGQQHFLGKYSLVIAILLIIIGIGGLMSPVLLSAVTDGVVAAILIVGGLTWVGHSYRLHAHGLADWLKPLLLLATGAIMVVLPAAGIASIGILFIFYFIVDAYRNFTQPRALGGIGRGWFIFGGIIDIVIAVLFLITWPQGSLVLVGIFVGVNLIFDGIILIMVRNTVIGGSTGSPSP